MITSPAQERFLASLRKAKRESVQILLVGLTGVGKSSLINALFGEVIGQVGAWEPTTPTIEVHPVIVGDIRFTIVDTPGLSEEEYFERRPGSAAAHRYLVTADCILFVSRLDDSRLRSDEIRLLETLFSSGQTIIERLIVVFTFADRVHDEMRDFVTERRGELFKDKLAVISGNPMTTRRIPVIPVSTIHPMITHGRDWRQALFEAMSATMRLPWRH